MLDEVNKIIREELSQRPDLEAVGQPNAGECSSVELVREEPMSMAVSDPLASLPDFEELFPHHEELIDIACMDNERDVVRSSAPLQVLEIERNDITFSKRTVSNLNFVMRFGNLQTINLSYNNLGDLGIYKLSIGLAGKISLQKIIIVACKITMPGAHQFFENMASNASLKEIKIDSNSIGVNRHVGNPSK